MKELLILEESVETVLQERFYHMSLNQTTDSIFAKTFECDYGESFRDRSV